MKCSNCQAENEAGNRFCIYCGVALLPPDAGKPIETGAASGNLEEQIRRLSNNLASVERRLAALENKLSGVQSISVTKAPAVPRMTPVTGAGVTTKPETPAEPPEKTAVPPARSEPSKPKEWEQILGGNWLARIGVLALILGVVFFFKYAFDNNWFGPLARVISGVLAGFALLGGGYFWRQKYPIFAQAIAGGGIAILYISIFAASLVFHFIGIFPSMIIVLCISIGSAYVAIRYNALAMEILGIIGAFTAPFILGTSLSRVQSNITGVSMELLLYVIIVDIGVLILSTFRNFRWSIFLALAASFLFFIVWHAYAGDRVNPAVFESGLTLIFLVFVAATTVYHFFRRIPANELDYSLMSLNAAAYLILSYSIMWQDHRAVLGVFTLILAFFYACIALLMFRRTPQHTTLGFFALGIAIVLFTISVPVQLRNQAWTTLAWAVELVIMTWFSFALPVPKLRGYAYAVFVLLVGQLLFFKTAIAANAYQPVLNERFLAYFMGIAAAYIAGYFISKYKNSYPEWEIPYSTLIVGAHFLTLWLLSVEVWDYSGSFQNNLAERFSAQQLSLTVLWALYAVGLLIYGILRRSRPVRLAGLGLLVIPVVKLFVYDVFTLKQVYRIVAFVCLGILLLAGGYLYQRYSKAIKGFILKK